MQRLINLEMQEGARLLEDFLTRIQTFNKFPHVIKI